MKRSPSKLQNSSHKHLSPSGGLRVLLCEKKSEVYNLSLPISENSYYFLERHFNLHPSTLPSFYNLNGACSLYTNYETQKPRRLRSVGTISLDFYVMVHYAYKWLAIVIKASQKVQVGTWCLSLSHDFRSSITTAFILSEPIYRENKWSHFVLSSLFDEVWDLVESTPQFCNHPAFLPTVLLCMHVHRATDYCILHGGPRLNELEDEVGVIRTGPLVREPAKIFFAHKHVREPQKESWSLLVNLNCRLTETLFMIRISEWQKDCISFLLESVKHISETAGPDLELTSPSNSILEMLQYLQFMSKSLFDYNNEHKSRIQSQLDAVSTFQSHNVYRLTNINFPSSNPKLTTSSASISLNPQEKMASQWRLLLS